MVRRIAGQGCAPPSPAIGRPAVPVASRISPAARAVAGQVCGRRDGPGGFGPLLPVVAGTSRSMLATWGAVGQCPSPPRRPTSCAERFRARPTWRGRCWCRASATRPPTRMSFRAGPFLTTSPRRAARKPAHGDRRDETSASAGAGRAPPAPGGAVMIYGVQLAGASPRRPACAASRLRSPTAVTARAGRSQPESVGVALGAPCLFPGGAARGFTCQNGMDGESAMGHPRPSPGIEKRGAADRRRRDERRW